MFEFYNSTIRHNFALSGIVSEIFSSQLTSMLSDSKVEENVGMSKQQIMQNILPQSYIFETFREYLNNNLYLLNSNEAFTCFKVVRGQISMINSEFVNQQYVIYAINSKVSLSHSRIENMSIDSRLFRISESDMNIESMTLTNLSCSSRSYELFYFIKAYVEVQTLNYSNSTCQLMTSSLSQINLKSLNSQLITLANMSLVILHHSLSSDLNQDRKEIPTCITSSSFSNISITNGYLILIKDSGVSDISNSSFFNIEAQVFKVEESHVKNAEGLIFFKGKQPLLVRRSTIDLIHNSRFLNCGGSNINNGGAIRLIDSNTEINQSEFKNNTANIGACISVECNFGQACNNKFAGLVIEDNTASQMGGGVYYNLVRPVMQNITYQNNSALYGPDIASYAVKIVQRHTKNNKIYLNNIGSGLKYGQTLYFDLVDYDGQVMVLENSYTLKILTNSTEISVEGTVFNKFKDGQAKFDNLIFNGKVGLHNATYMLTTASINTRTINEILDNSDEEYSNFIDASFRHCKPGEIQTSDDHCEECKPGSYTLSWNSTECLPCVNFATCAGKDEIKVDQGYWRRSTNSEFIVECPNPQACLGGFNPTSEYGPVKCKTGYRGLLCTKCDIIEGVKYQPLAGSECSKCPDPALNAIRVICFSGFAFCFLILLVYINLRKKKESQTSILLRILTNYMHLITAFFTFNVRMPTNITSVFNFTNRISSPDETFLSFDCFITDYEVKMFAPSNELFKMVIYIFFPVIMAFLLFLLFLIIRLVHYCIWMIKTKHYEEDSQYRALFDFKRSMVVSVICVIFLFHPTLTMKSLSMFLCIDIDDGDSRMKHHLEYKCYSADHIKWIFLVSLPTLVIWVLGVPLILLRVLIKNRKNLSETKMQRYFLILYQGFKEKTFYWEFIIARIETSSFKY